MDFTYFLEMSARIFLNPFKTLIGLSRRMKGQPSLFFKFGFLTSLMGNASLFISYKLMNSEIHEKAPSVLFSLFYTLFINYTLDIFIIASTYFLLSFTKRNIDIFYLTGIFLFSEFTYIILLPLSLIFMVIPVNLTGFYEVLVLTAIVLSFFLKIKSLSIASKISLIRSFSYILLPFLIIILFVSFNIIYLINYFSILVQ